MKNRWQVIRFLSKGKLTYRVARLVDPEKGLTLGNLEFGSIEDFADTERAIKLAARMNRYEKEERIKTNE